MEALALASSLGFQFAVAASLGFLLGYWLDHSFGWRPVAFTILFGLAGASAGLLLIVRTLRRIERRDRSKR